MFPDLSPVGGVDSALDGVPLLISDSAAPSTLTVFDASQIAVSAGLVELDRSDVASLQLADIPDSPPVPTSSYTNLWQQNLSALRAERYLGITRLKSTAVAQIANVTGIGNSPN
jgi:hypothetical protein